MQASLARLLRQVRSLGLVQEIQRVLDTYTRAGGGLLAGGLAHAAIFALLPALLLAVGVAGLVVSDPAVREELITQLASQVPPLEEFVRLTLEALSTNAVPFSALALIGLVWGASQLYSALDNAIARIFRDSPRRGFILRSLRGLVSVAVVMTAFVAALALASLASLLEESLPAERTGVRLIARIASPLVAAVVMSLALAVIYRVVPTRDVHWRSLAPPALVGGLILALVTNLFAYIAPRLVGTAAVYGSLVAVFAALAWLSIVFQTVLLGAAWTREREVGPEPTPAPDVADGSGAT